MFSYINLSNIEKIFFLFFTYEYNSNNYMINHLCLLTFFKIKYVEHFCSVDLLILMIFYF